MTTPHPDAVLLRAIADGKQMQGECLGPPWIDIDARAALAAVAQGLPCRIKPDFVLVNGVECPKPLTEGDYPYTVTTTVRCGSHTESRIHVLGFDYKNSALQVFDAIIKPFKECQE